MNDTFTATFIIAAFAAGITSGAAVATAYWRHRRNAEADANWARYVESERQSNTMRRELEAAQQRNADLEAERGIAACQITMLAAVATVATQQAQAGKGYDLSETAIDRICPN